MNEFKNFDHSGANDFSAANYDKLIDKVLDDFGEVNYNELIDKVLDPKLSDHECRPKMKLFKRS